MNKIGRRKEKVEAVTVPLDLSATVHEGPAHSGLLLCLDRRKAEAVAPWRYARALAVRAADALVSVIHATLEIDKSPPTL